jgi:hypothetical protein
MWEVVEKKGAIGAFEAGFKSVKVQESKSAVELRVNPSRLRASPSGLPSRIGASRVNKRGFESVYTGKISME